VLIAVGAGLLLALAAVVRLAVQQRRLAGIHPRRLQINGERFPAGRGSFRAYGERMRVTPNERGMDMLVLGLALATAVALAALAAG
jgi:hypothetical protein